MQFNAMRLLVSSASIVLSLQEETDCPGITGLAPVQFPRPILLEKYNATLSVLSQMPTSSVYRKATEALTKQRIAIVEGTEDINEIEQRVGSGLAEELIQIAQDELNLAQKMALWKPWEQLEEAAPAVGCQFTKCRQSLILFRDNGRGLMRGNKTLGRTVDLSIAQPRCT